jgi:hypothetical protein
MEKLAARYASQPSFPGQPLQFPPKHPNVSIAPIVPLGGGAAPPNPLAQIKPPAPGLATAAGVQQALGKVAASRLLSSYDIALNESLATLFSFGKQADLAAHTAAGSISKSPTVTSGHSLGTRALGCYASQWLKIST